MRTAWLAFYRGEGPDSEGRLLREILTWNDDALESVHDYIQWLFPLPEPSLFNADAPLLTPEEIAEARSDATIQANLHAAFARMLRFYALTPETEGNPRPWVCAADHNHLRITRILRSLCLLGRRDEARTLYDGVSRFNDAFPARTKQFWRNAMTAD